MASWTHGGCADTSLQRGPCIGAINAKYEGAARELHSTLARGLELGAQQVAKQLGLFVCSELSLSMYSSKCHCHIGYYSNAQMIGTLLHLAVQLALFPNAPVAEASTQVGAVEASEAGWTREAKMQVGVETSEAEQQCPSPRKPVQPPDCVPDITDDITELRGEWQEFANAGVRIGGGYHLFRQPGHRSQSPGRRPHDSNAAQRAVSLGAVTPGSSSRGRGQRGHSIPATASAEEHVKAAQAYAAEITDARTRGPFQTTSIIVTDASSWRQEQEVIDIGVALDHDLPGLPLDADTVGGDRDGTSPVRYDHFVHGAPNQGTPQNRYSVGQYSNSQHRSLTRHEIKEALKKGCMDSVQLYRVLKPQGDMPLAPSPIEHEPFQQGRWRRKSRESPLRKSRGRAT